jgi:hypothetical protein
LISILPNGENSANRHRLRGEWGPVLSGGIGHILVAEPRQFMVFFWIKAAKLLRSLMGLKQASASKTGQSVLFTVTGAFVSRAGGETAGPERTAKRVGPEVKLVLNVLYRKLTIATTNDV